jgi:hypothetical protein
MAGSITSFSAMALGARELSSELGTFQRLLIRSIIGLPLIDSWIIAGAGLIVSRQLDQYHWRAAQSDPVTTAPGCIQ